MRKIAISVITTGQIHLLKKLFTDLNSLASAPLIHVIVTFNLVGEKIDFSQWKNLSFESIINTQKKGFARNHNAAFKVSNSEWFLILNPDVRITKDPFRALIKSASNPAVGVSTVVIKNSSNMQEDFARVLMTPISLTKRFLSNSTPYEQNEFIWIAGMFMFFNSKVYKKINGLDERYFLYCEDCDICIRLTNLNYKINILDNQFVIHDSQRTSHKSFQYFSYHVISLIKIWLSSSFWILFFHNRKKTNIFKKSSVKILN